jgi:hypothetical protein
MIVLLLCGWRWGRRRHDHGLRRLALNIPISQADSADKGNTRRYHACGEEPAAFAAAFHAGQ